MTQLGYDSLNTEERQYVDGELQKFAETNSSKYSYTGVSQVRRIYLDLRYNNRRAAIILLLEIYRLEKPDNYFADTRTAVLDSLIGIAINYKGRVHENEICEFMLANLYQQTEHCIQELVFLSTCFLGKEWEHRFLEKVYQGLSSNDIFIKQKAEGAKYQMIDFYPQFKKWIE